MNCLHQKHNTQHHLNMHGYRINALNIILLATLITSCYASGADGNKSTEIPRCRKDFMKDIVNPLGSRNFRCSYRMTLSSFNPLHNILLPQLNKHFFPKGGGKRDPTKHSYLICTKIRLSIALRFFAGGSPLDIMLTYGVSFWSSLGVKCETFLLTSILSSESFNSTRGILIMG